MAEKSPTKRAKTKAAVARKAAPAARAEEPKATPPFPVVGMGAPAGGLEAFTAVLHALAPDTGMAFVLIQHLDPKHASLLVELLAKATNMPVEPARDGARVTPNRVYVIPENVNLIIERGVLRLTARPAGRTVNMPVDCFFRSLAEDQGERAIGVILSGTSSDGALGIDAIKGAGGITMAQDQTAKYDGMPRAAVATGCIDFVLPPDRIARELARIALHPYVRFGAGDAEPPRAEPHSQPLSRIFALLRSASTVDFSLYKHTTIRRRLERRKALHKLESMDEYVAYLEENPAEVEALCRELLIKVTAFFRDPEVFTALKNKFLPEIVARLRPDMPIRVWVPGCATGEEAYSLAIVLLEYLRERNLNSPIQIFATDISDEALEKARAGVYVENISMDVSADRLRRFFVKHNGGYQVSQAVRDLCVFARQNVAKDPPFSKVDLISCRNLLIYLEAVLQKRIIPMFHHALKPHGLLVLGGSETIGAFEDLFEVADKGQRIFMKRHMISPPRFAFEPGNFAAGGDRGTARGSQPPEELHAPDLQREADRVILSQYGPPGVIVNDDFEVVQFRGRTSRYLEPSPGKASLNLLKMVRDGLLLEVRNAIQKVKRSGEPVHKKNVATKQADGFHDVDFDVLPLAATVQGRHYLVLFRNSEKPAAPGARERGRGAGDRRVEEVKQELIATRQYLQSIIEEQDATNEELQSANEEILSSNEELQSINEELETAKEELQSTNEELTTVNEELQNRNMELSQINDDLHNLLSSVNIAIVMLSSDLRVRRFTPVAGRILNLIPGDIGRPITDLRPSIHVPDLGEMIADVLETVVGKDRDVADKEGHWYSMSIRPYRTSDNRIDGAVLTLLDIESIQRGFDPSRSYRDFIQTAIDLVDDPMAVIDFEYQVRYANQPFRELFLPTGWDGGVFRLGGTMRSLIEPIAHGDGNDGRVHEVELPSGRRKLTVHAHAFPATGGREMLVVRLADAAGQ